MSELFCKKCGADIQETDEVCSKCGERVIKKSPGILFVGLIIGIIIVIFVVLQIIRGLSGASKAQGQAKENICLGNMKTISTTLEMYRADTGRYPSALGALTPNYLKTIPTCHAAGLDKYSGSYKADPSGNSYVFYCSGSNHRDAGLLDNFPQYYSGKGVALKPEEVPAATNNPPPFRGSGGSGDLLDIPRPPKPRVPDSIRKPNINITE